MRHAQDDPLVPPVRMINRERRRQTILDGKAAVRRFERGRQPRVGDLNHERQVVTSTREPLFGVKSSPMNVGNQTTMRADGISRPDTQSVGERDRYRDDGTLSVLELERACQGHMQLRPELMRDTRVAVDSEAQNGGNPGSSLSTVTKDRKSA